MDTVVNVDVTLEKDRSESAADFDIDEGEFTSLKIISHEPQVISLKIL